MFLGRAQDLVLGPGVLLAGARFLGDDVKTLLDRSKVGEHQVEGEFLELGTRLGLRTEAPRYLDQHTLLARKAEALRTTPGPLVLDPHLGHRGLARFALPLPALTPPPRAL